jgi:hypothetical protein
MAQIIKFALFGLLRVIICCLTWPLFLIGFIIICIFAELGDSYSSYVDNYMNWYKKIMFGRE